MFNNTVLKKLVLKTLRSRPQFCESQRLGVWGTTPGVPAPGSRISASRGVGYHAWCPGPRFLNLSISVCGVPCLVFWPQVPESQHLGVWGITPGGTSPHDHRVTLGVCSPVSRLGPASAPVNVSESRKGDFYFSQLLTKALCLPEGANNGEVSSYHPGQATSPSHLRSELLEKSNFLIFCANSGRLWGTRLRAFWGDEVGVGGIEGMY